MRLTTVGELGANLPIGFFDGKKLIKEFAIRPYKSRIDRHLGDWLESNANKYASGPLAACRVAKFISMIISEYGGKSIKVLNDGNSDPESELAIYKWFYVDVFYMFIFSRIASLGSELSINFFCPKCEKINRITFDLKTIEVNVVEDSDEIEKWIKLKDPIKLRDGGRCKKIKIRPSKWSMMTKPGISSGNMGAVSYAALEDSIFMVDTQESEYQFSTEEIDEISKVDMLKIDYAAKMNDAGATLSTRVICPEASCDGMVENAFDWSFDYFFGLSSQVLET